MYFGRHTAVDTIAQTLLVANGIVEARANGARERSIERDEEEDDRTGGRKSRGLFMGLSFGRGNRGGYEPVSQV